MQLDPLNHNINCEKSKICGGGGGANKISPNNMTSCVSKEKCLHLKIFPKLQKTPKQGLYQK